MKSLFTRRKLRAIDVLQHTVATLEKKVSISTRYFKNIAQGKFEIQANEIPDEVQENEDNFYKTIKSAQTKLMEYAQQEKEQQWAAAGLSQFMDVMQGDTGQEQSFYDNVLSLLVKYSNANQGGLFLLNDLDPGDAFLEMRACYAFGKKRFQQKRVDLGQGILGQCYLEGTTLQLNQVPIDYIEITSGLGEATPTFLLMVPLRYNDMCLGILELASFTRMKKHQINFLERVGENLAAAIQSKKNAMRVDMLYKESHEKALRLQEKEESLRQNMEELVATQEEMKRHQIEVSRQSELLKFIIDNIPFPIFVKDEVGRYAMVNNSESRLFALSEQEIIGKNDRAFVSSDEEWEVIRQSDEKVIKGHVPVELPLQQFTTKSGTRYVFKTTKIPFLNPVTNKRNILGVSIDLTEKLDLEQQLHQKKLTTINHALINLAGRQRMLSQRIAFHCEAVARGRRHFIELLRETMALYEHSFLVIQFGGKPKGIDLDVELPPAKQSLLPLLHSLEVLWADYKQATNGIIELAEMNSGNGLLMEGHLQCIEEKSEQLLFQNNALTHACSHLE